MDSLKGSRPHEGPKTRSTESLPGIMVVREASVESDFHLRRAIGIRDQGEVEGLIEM
jgi:hypothetical protein